MNGVYLCGICNKFHSTKEEMKYCDHKKQEEKPKEETPKEKPKKSTKGE